MAVSKKEIFIFLGIIALFVAVRLPGLSIPYHQDEYKWPLYAEEKVFEPGSVVHPPLTEFLYRVIGKYINLNHFRFIPFTFGIINLFLLFCLVQIMFDRKTAIWSVVLFAVSFYSVLASLMVDVDGAVMPMFMLLMMIGYYRMRQASFDFKKTKGWLLVCIIGAIGGFLVKMSGVLPLMAIVLDISIIKGLFSDRKRFLKFLGLSSILALGIVGVLLLAKLVFPFFPLEKSLVYWQHFAVFAGRGWFQTFIQFTKAILYTSPLLILPPLFIDREMWRKTRPFFFFIFFGLFFYLIAFDFSLGALDRYFQFLVIPLCIISGAVFSKYVHFQQRSWFNVFIGIVSIGIISLQFLNHVVPPQYPKTEWINRLLSFKWNFLFPFTGGSGPTGFYISFVFIAVTWIVCLVFLRKKFLLGILVIGILYNAVFIEEYLFGKINGSPYELFRNAKTLIIKDPNIKQVIVYNDIGGYEIRQTGKYARRMYAAPQFEEGYKKILSNFSGHILFIDIPRVYENSFYKTYMNDCKTIFSETDKYITGTILDCRK